MSEEHEPLPEMSAEDMQIFLAKVSLSLAQLARLVERHLGPKNALLADPDPYHTAKEAKFIYDEMMLVTGALIGAKKNG